MESDVPGPSTVVENGYESTASNSQKFKVDSHDESSKNFENSRKELDTGYRILTDIIKQNRSTCFEFMDEVDVEQLGLWDYHKRIKEPMWLNKMTDKFLTNEYKNITEFVRDFRLMVENCYRYNGTDHVVSKKARRLELLIEGKLALLNGNMRQKTSIQVTSGSKYTIDKTSEELQPYHVVSRATSRTPAREYTATGEELKLVYDFVRCEEFMLTADNGKNMTHRERRQQETLYRQLAGNWISTLHTREFLNDLKTSHVLPEIGFFMHLSQSVMKFPNLSMYVLERCLLFPKKSAYLAKVMSSLLCSYPERNLLQHRPPMQFRTWHERLVTRVNKWFDKVLKHRSFEKVVDKCNLTMEFFEALNWKNPFSDPNTTFADLSYTARAHIIKALCENLSSLQSIQTLFNNADPLELQCMRLGYDLEGNCYIYFPQFCGDDVRLYRHRQNSEPRQTNNIPSVQEIEKLLSYTPPHISTIASNEIDANEIQKIVNDIIDMVSDNLESKPNIILNGTSHHKLNEIIDEQKPKSPLIEELDSVNDNIASEDSKKLLNTDDDEEIIGKQVDNNSKTTRPHRKNTKINNAESPVIPPEVRRSSRRRSIMKKVSPEKEIEKKTPTKKSKRGRRSKPEKKTVPKAPKERFGSVDFELICEDVSDIHNLISKLEATMENADLTLYTRAAKIEMADLIEQIKWLLGELKPFDGKMNRAKVENQIKLKKEFDELSRDAAIGKHKPDPWCDEDVIPEQPPVPMNFLEDESRVGRKRRSPMRYSDGEDERDISDEDYIPDVTTPRHFVQVPKMNYDHSRYEMERLSLLPAALDEMGRILRENIRLVTKVTNRSALRESAINDRKTRLKSKSENKVVQRLLLLTEACVKERPSLIPILVPLPEIVEVVDLLLTEEDFAKREAQRSRLAKKNCIAVKRQRLAINKTKKELVDDLENIVVDKEIKTEENNHTQAKNGFINKSLQRAKPYKIQDSESVVCRMSNGKLINGVKLKDGTIIPIQRSNNDSSPAGNVTELIKTLTKQAEQNQRTQNTVPHISLRSPPKVQKLPPPKPQITDNTNLRNTAALGLINLQNGSQSITPRFGTVPMVHRFPIAPQPKFIQVQIPSKRGIQVLPTTKLVAPVKYVLPISNNNAQQIRLPVVTSSILTQPKPQLRYASPVFFTNNQQNVVIQPASIASQNIIVQPQLVTVQSQMQPIIKQADKNASN